MQAVTKEYTDLQQELSEAVMQGQKLQAQINENEAVEKELLKLGPNDEVYKQLGSVLLRQDLVEAKDTVHRRLELISNESKKVESQIAEIEGKIEGTREKLIKLQQEQGTAQAA